VTICQACLFKDDKIRTWHKKWRNFVSKKSAKCSRPEISEFLIQGWASHGEALPGLAFLYVREAFSLFEDFLGVS
jgi:hypothetical protein